MAIIGKIRKHSGLTIAVVGIAMFAFIIGDFSKGGMGSSMVIGDIDGESISWQEFEQLTERNAELQKLQRQTTNLTSEEMFTVREQTWTEFLEEIILGKEYDDLGIVVTEDEMQDLVLGETPHRFIAQSFTNQQTGQLDREMLVNFMQTLEQRPAGVQQQMENLLFQIRKDGCRTKYNSLISKGYYVPTAIAAHDYKLKNRKANLNIVGLKYSDIADSTIKVSDDQLRKYYKEHKSRYEQNVSRDIEYIVFEVKPSATDRKETKQLVDELSTELKTTKANDINYFVNSVSDARYDSSWLTKEQVPARLNTSLFVDEIGTVVPTYLDNNAYFTARLISREMRPDSIKAQHILVAYNGAYGADSVTRTKDDAQKLADSLLNILQKKNSNLETLATTFSDDPSVATTKGDLGWFADGHMLPAFNEVCVNNKKGSFVIAETVFGYHVILVEDKLEDVEKVQVAFIKRDILASSATRQDVYRNASEVAVSCNNVQEFRDFADKQHYNIRTRDYLQPMTNSIAGISYPRQILRWAYNEETAIDNVSDVFEDDNNFVIAALTGTHAKGITPFDQIKEQLEPLVLKEEKAKTLATRLESGKSINEIAKALNVTVVDAQNISMSSFNIPTYGRETKVIGAATALNKGETISQPINGGSGVYTFDVTSVTDAPEREDFATQKTSLERAFGSKVSGAIFRALQDESEIEDNRVRFY